MYLLTCLCCYVSNLIVISIPLTCSHSDNNLVEMGEVKTKEEEVAVLLEGGGLPRSVSTRFYNSPVKTNLIR